MNTVVQAMIAILLVIIGLTAVYTATDATVDSADDTVTENQGSLTSCLGEGLESEDCQLFETPAEDGEG